jgi:o-succinylbenzoate---CoA ligase
MKSILLNGTTYNRYNLEKLYVISESNDSWQNALYFFLKNWYDDTDFILAHTSGSTGTPKSIRLPKASVENSARMTNQFLGLTEESVGLLCLPASYIAGKMMLVRAIVGGYNLLAVSPSANPFKTTHTPVDFAAITPYQLFHAAGSLQQQPVGKIIVGGGPVNSKLEKLAETIPAELYETYGMTETCSHIALRRFNGIGKSEYFTVLEGVTIRVDERECLAIKAPHLLKDEIQTNDIVELKGTRMFRWLGRADSTINSGGVKIHPEQLEKKLEGIIPSACFIASVPDDVLGNKVVLVIESEAYSQQQEKALITQFEQLFSKYEIPKQLIYIPAFMYSESHKVLRKDTLANAIK